MVKNEEYWIGHVLEAALLGFDHVIVADCASRDRTFEIIRAVLGSRAWPATYQLLTFDHMTPAINGRVRQIMTDLTKTEWAMLCDGDEYFLPGVVKNIKAGGIPAGKRLGFTTAQAVRWIEGQFWKAEKHSAQRLFHVPTTSWTGEYPFEGPTWYDQPETFYYFPDFDGVGYHTLDFHYLARSSKDDETYHRHDAIRLEQAVTEPIVLPLDLSKWPNPYAKYEKKEVPVGTKPTHEASRSDGDAHERQSSI